jgi:UDP-2,3-diacylglucosamine hydrolase
MRQGSYVPFLGKDKEHQVIFAREQLKKDPTIEYFIFGHRHVPFQIRISETCHVINLGDWISNFTYAVFDGNEFQLRTHLEGQGEIIRIE